MHEYQRILGDRVKEARNKRGLTQVQLAERIQSNKRTILDIERGNGNPKLETLVAILTYLEIDPYTIFYHEPQERSAALLRLEQQLHGCSEEEIQMLSDICRSVLSFAHMEERIAAC